MPAPKTGGYHDGHSEMDNYASLTFYKETAYSDPLLKLTFAVKRHAEGDFVAVLSYVMASLELLPLLTVPPVETPNTVINRLPAYLHDTYGGRGEHHAGYDGKAHQEHFLQMVKQIFVQSLGTELYVACGVPVVAHLQTRGCHEGLVEFRYERMAA